MTSAIRPGLYSCGRAIRLYRSGLRSLDFHR